MKAKSLIVLTAVAAMFLTACQERSYINNPGEMVDQLPDSIPVPQPTPDPEGFVVPEGTINVLEAYEIGQKLQRSDKDHKYPTEETYYIKGWVRNFDEKERAKSDFEDKFKQYGNDYVYLSARQDGAGSRTFYCYRALGRGGAKLPSHDVLQIGDFVVVKCAILNFSGTIESDGTCSIEYSTNPLFEEAFKPGDTIYATCEEAKTAALALAENNTPTKDIYVIDGYVQSAGYSATVSRGQQIFWIADTKDGGKVFESYYCNVPNGEAVQVGQKVRLTGPIMKYNTTPEMKNGDVTIIEEAEN